MPEGRPKLAGKIIQAPDDEELFKYYINQNFARIQEFIDQVERFWPLTAITPLGVGLPFLFGDGSDGDLTISSNTSWDNTKRLQQFDNFILESGNTLDMSGVSLQSMIIYCRNLCQIDGTIDLSAGGHTGPNGTTGNGSDATLSNGAYPEYEEVTAKVDAGSLGGAGGGGGGGNTTTGGDGADTMNEDGGPGGGASANGTAAPDYDGSDDKLRWIKSRWANKTKDHWPVSLGAGGGAGGGNASTNSGGDGGNGGGVVIIIARRVVITGTINVSGEAGGTPVGSSTGGGGGGGGGSIFIVSREIVDSAATYNTTGGAGGTGKPGQGNGGAGGDGPLLKEVIP